MLNKYLDLLQHATEAMTNVGKSGAGATEYFQAVGYELLIIGLGLLYLAGIVLLIAVPVLAFYRGVVRGGFASKKLKEMCKIAEEYTHASKQYKKLRYDFSDSEKKWRVKNFEKLCEHIGRYYKDFTKEEWYDRVPGDTLDEKKKFLQKVENPYDFSFRVPQLYGIFEWKSEGSICSKITQFDLFNDIAVEGEEASTFTEQVKKLYSTEDIYYHDVKIFKIKCVSIMTVLMMLYAVFMLPLCLMFF